MFCPKCGTEYREGFYKCADCDIDLVYEPPEPPKLPELPPEPEPEFIDYEEVLATDNPGDIALLKSILESEGIVYFFKGEHCNYMRSLIDSVRLMVRKDQIEDARNLLADLKLSFMEINLHKTVREGEEKDS